ncbi:hydrolase or metal-binding protein [Pseudomonas nitroreducens]|uniref:recombination directionality factor n=1 Tax=Pseudomonas TaxID=286 RepID=UPI000806AFB1|nr:MULTISPECIES: hydrolase or metal-binding protein [Pseudomonas]NMZ76651.1 hydrolase or metal-binding protein [Pseudomonas nitroreducens]OBY59311.1 hydrolase or metal-binding protein [Pseudomonas sp. AU12215]
MLKGLAITPPVLGRISIGKVVEKNGKRLPEKDDQFTITTQIQLRDHWLTHPLDEELRKAQGGKIRSIPIRLLFNAPDLNFRAEYCLFDRQTGRPICMGNGETCKRRGDKGVESLPCPSPDGCPLAKGGACKPYGRLNVAIGDEDSLGSFVFRTTGFNSIRTLAARLQYLQAISGDRLACLPLELRLRGKSTRQSHGLPIFYVDITVRDGMSMEGALQHAREIDDVRHAAGFDQKALDAAAKSGLANGNFEDSEEEGEAIVEELFPEGPTNAVTSPTTADTTASSAPRPTLSTLLRARAEARNQ